MNVSQWAELFGCEAGPAYTWGPGECPWCHAQKFWLDASPGAEGYNCLACGKKGLGDDELKPFWRVAPAFRLASDLLANPDLLKPPRQALPRLGYTGRLVILCAPDKAGKSTLLAHGVAAMTRGRWFLGEHCQRGRALWVGLEEATSDAVRRFSELDADMGAIQTLTSPATNILDQAGWLLHEWPADLMVVDSLSEYARVTRGAAPADGDNGAWGEVVRPLVQLARQRRVALVLLHHVRKSDGKYRGASEIAAAADAMLEMEFDNREPTVRRITGRGRWAVEPFSVALRDGGYELANRTVASVDAQVIVHVDQNPGASLRSIRDAIPAQARSVDAALNRLTERGTIINNGTPRRSSYVLAHQIEIGAVSAA